MKTLTMCTLTLAVVQRIKTQLGIITPRVVEVYSNLITML